MKRPSNTILFVLCFIVVLLIASFSAREASAQEQFSIGLGETLINSNSRIGEIAYTNKHDFEFAASIIGEGSTEKGYQETVDIYSVSYITKPDWTFLGAKNYYKLGVSYVNKSTLVGPSNFRLGVGLDWNVFSLEYIHYSSADIHKTNTGIDAIVLKYNIPIL
jgi:hypothetical protein